MSERTQDIADLHSIERTLEQIYIPEPESDEAVIHFASIRGFIERAKLRTKAAISDLRGEQ